LRFGTAIALTCVYSANETVKSACYFKANASS